jgi:hypothetical protein
MAQKLRVLQSLWAMEGGLMISALWDRIAVEGQH